MALGSSASDPRSESVSIWFRLLSCHAVMLGELRRRLEDRMTMARFDLLASLHRHDGQTLAAISRALLVTAGNVTGLVDRAERDGVVERRPDPDDRRVARVWLTERGRALIGAVLPIHDNQVHELIAGMPREHRRDLRRLLGELRDHLSPREGRDEERVGSGGARGDRLTDAREEARGPKKTKSNGRTAKRVSP